MAILSFGRTLVSNLFKKPVTEGYPFEPREYTPRTRGHIVFDGDNCILCNICGRKCPSNAIRIDKTERMFIIERMRCVQCSACVDSCPKGCLSLDGHYITPSIQKVTDAYDVPVKEKPRTSEQTSE